MNPIDFGFSVLASWLANQLEKIGGNKSPQQNDVTAEDKETKKTPRLFKTYDVYTESEEIIKSLKDVVAHIVVENSPSTFYNLALLILESKLTGEWYVFRRGRIAFQGTGGGHQQSERLINLLKRENIPVAAWAGDRNILDSFESGTLLWPELKISLVPLAASIVEDEDWKRIQNKANEMLNKIEE
jgi:hypothetical protein